MTLVLGGEGGIGKNLTFDEMGGGGSPEGPQNPWRHLWIAPNNFHKEGLFILKMGIIYNK